MSNISEEHKAKLNDLRAKVLAGEDIPESELTEAVRSLIQARLGFLQTEKKKPVKGKSTPVDLDDLL
jgi:hypothetical protein